jgi:hypothetical protein
MMNGLAGFDYHELEAGHTPEIPKEIQDKARIVVAGNAVDADDARDLLEMLGLIYCESVKLRSFRYRGN